MLQGTTSSSDTWDVRNSVTHTPLCATSYKNRLIFITLTCLTKRKIRRRNANALYRRGRTAILQVRCRQQKVRTIRGSLCHSLNSLKCYFHLSETWDKRFWPYKRSVSRITSRRSNAYFPVRPCRPMSTNRTCTSERTYFLYLNTKTK